MSLRRVQSLLSFSLPLSWTISVWSGCEWQIVKFGKLQEPPFLVFHNSKVSEGVCSNTLTLLQKRSCWTILEDYNSGCFYVFGWRSIPSCLTDCSSAEQLSMKTWEAASLRAQMLTQLHLTPDLRQGFETTFSWTSPTLCSRLYQTPVKGCSFERSRVRTVLSEMCEFRREH